MQGLDPGRVAYAGTASKTLAPGVRLGWLILPRELVEPVAEADVVLVAPHNLVRGGKAARTGAGRKSDAEDAWS